MKSVPIHRRDETLPISPSAFKKFVYPFEEFPTIVSHVHPRFVICNAGLKFGNVNVLYAFAGAKKGELHDALLKVIHIYEEWSRVPLPNDFCRKKKVPKVRSRVKKVSGISHTLNLQILDGLLPLSSRRHHCHNLVFSQ